MSIRVPTRPRPSRLIGLVFAFFALAAHLLAGCGGDGASTARKPALRVSVAWPSPSARVVPSATKSVRVQVLNAEGGVTNEAVVVSPAAYASFAEAPTGNVTVRAYACPNADGTGNALASASVGAAIIENLTARVDLTMASTIDRLTISPDPVYPGLLQLGIQTAVTAYDAHGSVVMTSPGDLTYAVSDALLFGVDPNGLVVELAVGAGKLTVTDRVSGKSAQIPVVCTLV